MGALASLSIVNARTGPAWLLPLGASLVGPAALASWWWGWGDSGARLTWLGWMLYWWMPLTCAFAALCLCWRFRARSRPVAEVARAWWPGAALALAAVVTVVLVSPPQMRVQFDETCLLGVSQNMHLHGKALMTNCAVPYDGEPFPLHSLVDKRPTLFAFLCSLVHDVSGYRVGNAFFVNAALLWLGLFGVFVAVRARLGLVAGLAAPLWLLAVPLTSVVATSAGFELLAAVTLAFATIAALGFVAQPDEPRFAALLGCVALFAQSRYESLPAAALLVLLTAVAVRGRFAPSRRCWWLLAALPTLVSPLVLLADYAQDPNFTPEAGGRALVSFEHFFAHAPAFLAATFSPGLENAMPGIVAIVGAVAVVLRLCARQASRLDLLVAAPTTAITLLVLAWFYSDVEEATALRLFLPFAWLCALAPLALVRALPGRAMAGRCAFVLLAAALALAPLRLRELALGRAFPTLNMAALTKALDGVAARLPGERGRTMWVGTIAQYMVMRGHAAISPKVLKEALSPKWAQGDGWRRSFAQEVRARLRGQSPAGNPSLRGHVGTIYVIETTIDPAVAPAFGSPRELLRFFPGEVVERVGGEMPITVYRVGR